MSLDATRTVRDIAVEFPNATRVFEKLGIDYCCGGLKSLQEACSTARISTDEVLRSLEAARESREPVGSDWSTGELGELAQHIVNKHHAYVRSETPRLEKLLQKVCSVHGKNHPELLDIQKEFAGLSQELAAHMMKEEQILFPYIAQMEEARRTKGRIQPAMFGTVQNPVRMMMKEHDAAGEDMRRMRELSAGYTTPADACISFRTLYGALQEFEADLHQHIHLENNILFPRAIELENAA